MTHINAENIFFTFQNIDYEVSLDAYPDGFIRLPDQRLVKVGKWRENFPPIPCGLKVIEDTMEKIVDAVLAEE